MDDAEPIDFFKSIPPQSTNEGATFGPFIIRDYVQASPEEMAAFHFQVTLSNGEPLPNGLICTDDGILSGIPAKGTDGYYEIDLTANNQAGVFHTATFSLTINPSLMAAASTATAAEAITPAAPPPAPAAPPPAAATAAKTLDPPGTPPDPPPRGA